MKKIKRLLTIALAVAMTVTCMNANTMQANAKSKYMKVRYTDYDKRPFVTFRVNLPKNPMHVAENRYTVWRIKVLQKKDRRIIRESTGREPNGGCIPYMGYVSKPTDFTQNRYHVEAGCLAYGTTKFRVTAKTAYNTTTWTVLCTNKRNNKKKYAKYGHTKTSFRILKKTIKKTTAKKTIAKKKTTNDTSIETDYVKTGY